MRYRTLTLHAGASNPRGLRKARDLFFVLLASALVLSGAEEIFHSHVRSAFAHTGDGPRVLVLHSYHSGFPWTDNVMHGIESAFKAAGREVEFHVEYMDAKRHRPARLFPLLREAYRFKYSNQKLDAVICSDDAALDFLLSHRDELFPGVPVVFCGINDFSGDRISGRTGFTGVVEDFDLKSTIEIALKLHPGTRHIAVVSDSTSTGSVNLERFREVAPLFSRRVDFIELAAMTAEDLVSSLSALPPDTVVLHLSFYKDGNGKLFSVEAGNRLVAESSKLPVYTAWDFNLGTGVVGGMMVSGVLQGETAARIALEILDGRSVDSMPVLLRSPNRYMFDHEQLERFGIEESQLPEGSLTINAPEDIYSRHKRLIWTVAGSIGVLLALVFLLATNVRRRIRAEKLLRKAHEELENRVRERTAELLAANAKLALEIEERKQVERSLRQSESEKAAVLNNLQDINVKYMDSGMRILWGSKALEPYLSPSSGEAGKGIPCYRLVQGKESPCPDCIARKAIETGEFQKGEYLSPDGKSWLGRATPLKDEFGKVTSVVHVSFDITEKRRMENALHESEVLLSQIFRLSPALIVISRRSDGCYIDVNGAFTRLTGYEREEAVGRTSIELGIWEDPNQRRKMVELLQREGGIDNMEVSFRRKSGEVFPALCSVSPIEVGGEACIISVVMDISERKRDERERILLEQRLQQLQKAESLRRMAGAIAHHFNNMLGAVIGNLELALLDLPDLPQLRESIDEALEASLRAAEVSRFMLTYVGQTTGIKEPMDVNEACGESLSLLQASMQGGVSIKTLLSPEPAVIQCDAAHLRQIVTNLVSNAMEAIGEGGGEITVEVKAVAAPEIRENRFFPMDWRPWAANYVRLSVADNGCGMDEASLASIFDPFFSTKFARQGLGLAVVLGLVRTYEGAVAVESRPGQGATFRVFFPLFEQAEPRAGRELVPAAGEVEDRGVVLVVDDEPLVRNVAETMLKCWFGGKVLAAGDGPEALELFRRRMNEISLVLLDLGMPGMDGRQTLEALRTLRPDVPVILASGYEEEQVMQSDYPEKPQAFLHKPYRMADLKAALEAVRKV